MASVIAPAPPMAKKDDPAGCGSPAARMSSTRLLPADHGPMAVPKIPRAATVARRSSVSKNSATRSATAIGPQRRSRYISFFPSLRRLRPVWSMAHRSARLGSSMLGGGSFRASAITRPIFCSDACNTGYCAASFCENFEISRAARSTSLCSISARPSGESAVMAISGVTNFRP